MIVTLCFPAVSSWGGDGTLVWGDQLVWSYAFSFSTLQRINRCEGKPAAQPGSVYGPLNTSLSDVDCARQSLIIKLFWCKVHVLCLPFGGENKPRLIFSCKPIRSESKTTFCPRVLRMPSRGELISWLLNCIYLYTYIYIDNINPRQLRVLPSKSTCVK